jgi:hypothetical protein
VSVSTVVTIRPAATVFHEEQHFDWRVFAFIGVVELVGGYWIVWLTRHWAPMAALLAQRWSVEFSLTLLGTVSAPFLLMVALLQMTTEVTATEVRVWFGWLPVYRRAVPITAIRRYELLQYRPIRDHGGWGIRWGREGERVLTARGDRGVRIELIDGTKLLIGSQRPEELAETLERARNPNVP